MLSLLKKKSDASAAPQVPAWHPNFRNYERLPDIKVVRTAFFVNVAAITVALGLLIYFGFAEWNLRVVKGQVAEAEAQIARDKKESDQAVAAFGKFRTEETRIKDVDAFVKSKPVVSELLIRVAQTVPPNIAFDSIDLRETGLTLRLSVRGTPDAALGYATAYLEQLKKDEELLKLFEEPAYTGTPTRNATTGRMAVEFILRAKGAKK